MCLSLRCVWAGEGYISIKIVGEEMGGEEDSHGSSCLPPPACSTQQHWATPASAMKQLLSAGCCWLLFDIGPLCALCPTILQVTLKHFPHLGDQFHEFHSIAVQGLETSGFCNPILWGRSHQPGRGTEAQYLLQHQISAGMSCDMEILPIV